ncbi:MAG: AAA family ATPase [Nanoarchaeota archaeon]
MKIKRVVLNNIRSYKNQEVEFPEGSTLLSGDIGSGKTSVLLGIEFGLFGLQPGQKGSSLLKNGESDGGVTLEFEIDDKEIIIERTLKKGKTISQDYCSVSIDGEKKEISVVELKSLVLELLDYPKEFSRKQNLLYKFTVYTPQEEMKQIILQDFETRVNTLRHVFGIDKYKKILENSATLISKIREEKRKKEGMTADLEQDKIIFMSKENEIESKDYNLFSVEKELFLKTEQRKMAQEEKDEIAQKIDEKNKIQQEIEKTKIKIQHKTEQMLDNERMLEKIKIQLNELESIKFDESEIIELEEKLRNAKKQKEELNNFLIKISSQINSLNVKNRENENLKNNLAHIETCPTCLQEVNLLYKTNIFNKINYEISDNNEKIKLLDAEKNNLLLEIKKTDDAISFLANNIQEKSIMRIKIQNIKDKEERMSEIENNNFMLKKENSELKNILGRLANSLSELLKFDSVYEEKQKNFDEAFKQERAVELKVVELKKEIEVFSRQINELREKIKKTEEISKQLAYLMELENWLLQKFTPLISHIEKNVMLKLKSEFSNLFSQWFSVLVPENFSSKLDDNFTPVIEQQDYEIDYSYLSGGERTAVALAYRLALNQVINSLLSKIKTRDIVILDEPTDGFSEQQLDKMRDILNQLKVKQLIIVSHEQKIESFVENVVRFKKVDGVSVRE